jgi:DNA-binding NarL/FixJ family response regulator
MEVGMPVLVADDDEASRAALGHLLQGAGCRALLAETGDEALAIARTTPPSAAILEIPLPGLSGYEVCRALKHELGAEFPVVFLTGTRTEDHDRVAGLLLGADDYMVKPYAAGELLVRLEHLLRRSSSSRATTRLTSRELEVLELMGEGLQQREIAQRLFISPKTVATHVEHILRKLGVRSRAAAVAVAYREAILRPPAIV